MTVSALGKRVAAHPAVRSPLVRRLIAEHRLDPADIVGTGRNGRINRSDVESHLAQRKTSNQAGDRPPEHPPQWMQFNTIRRRTAERMTLAHATIPQVTTTTVVDFERVQRVRSAARQDFRSRYDLGLTFLPFVVRAILDAVGAFPRLNARVDGDGLVVHERIDLGIAVDLDHEGLLVPVIRDAAAYRLPVLAQRISQLSEAARRKRLTVADLTGSTMTLTSPGSHGTFVSTPIINPPEVAIVSVEGISKQVVVVPDADGNDAIAIHHVGVVGLSYDHRAFDGAYAAAFLARVREIIQGRDWHTEL